MYLDQVNYELNKKINEFVCNSNDAPTPEERIDILKQAWELLPKPATQFVEPTSAIACGVSENYKKLGDYQKALEWMLIALEHEKMNLQQVCLYGQESFITNWVIWKMPINILI